MRGHGPPPIRACCDDLTRAWLVIGDRPHMPYGKARTAPGSGLAARTSDRPLCRARGRSRLRLQAIATAPRSPLAHCATSGSDRRAARDVYSPQPRGTVAGAPGTIIAPARAVAGIVRAIERDREVEVGNLWRARPSAHRGRRRRDGGRPRAAATGLREPPRTGRRGGL